MSGWETHNTTLARTLNSYIIAKSKYQSPQSGARTGLLPWSLLICLCNYSGQGSGVWLTTSSRGGRPNPRITISGGWCVCHRCQWYMRCCDLWWSPRTQVLTRPRHMVIIPHVRHNLCLGEMLVIFMWLGLCISEGCDNDTNTVSEFNCPRSDKHWLGYNIMYVYTVHCHKQGSLIQNTKWALHYDDG